MSATPENAFRPIRRIGGKQGRHYANFLWTIRGWIDLICGGVGRRRARRDLENLQVGEVLDWWRVGDYQPDRRLRLAAEMKVPGRAWLEFDVEPCEEGSTSVKRLSSIPRVYSGLPTGTESIRCMH